MGKVRIVYKTKVSLLLQERRKSSLKNLKALVFEICVLWDYMTPVTVVLVEFWMIWAGIACVLKFDLLIKGSSITIRKNLLVNCSLYKLPDIALLCILLNTQCEEMFYFQSSGVSLPSLPPLTEGYCSKWYWKLYFRGVGKQIVHPFYL